MVLESRLARPLAAFFLLSSLLPLAACGDRTELVSCGAGGHMVERPVESGTEIYCRLDTKVAHGEYRFEDVKGVALITGFFDQGRAHGEWTWWYPDGKQIEKKGTYEYGEAHGLWEGFDQNGTRRWEHHFDTGIGCGTWLDWDEQGEQVATTTYAACDGGGSTTPEGITMAPLDLEPEWDCIQCPPGTGMDPTTVNQDERWCIDYVGAKSGPFCRYFPGQVQPQEIGSFDKGLKAGTWTTWNQDGSVLSVGSYKEGERDGEWWSWRADGTPVESGQYSAGKRTGKWTAWYGTCLKKWEGSYVDGLEDGAWSTWWPSGIQSETSTWKAGQLDGASKSFWASGNPNEQGDYQDGRKEGTWKGFWPNGNPYWEGPFKSGWRDGQWQWWKEKGGPDMEGSYDMQVPIGDWTTWATDTATGKLLVGTGPFDGGHRNGIWKWTWEEEGTPESEILYVDDLREGPFLSYWPDGLKRIDGYFLAGVGQYLWTFYHPNGQMSLQQTLNKGLPTGLSTEWWPDGSKKAEGSYGAYGNEGRKIGVWTYWDEQGNMTTETFDEWGNPK